MSQPLGKVTFDLDVPRGPDVKFEIQVPSTWFGTRIAVVVPRNLNCAGCDGGGCDTCERQGALSVRGRSDLVEPLSVQLPRERGADVCLRIPGLGGKREGLPRGHLLLLVRCSAGPSESAVPSEGVTQVLEPAAEPEDERRLLMKRSLVMAVVLVLVFFGMLRLSGWL